MGIFDDGYQQSIIDAARQPIDRPPAGFMESFSASYDTTRQEDLSISERQNYLDKVKIRNEKILELTGQPFTATANPTDPGLTTVEKARLSAERQIRELSNQHAEIKNDDDILKEIIEDSKRLREKSESVTSNSTFAGKVGSFTGAMAATLTDPLVIATLPFGASTSAGILKRHCLKAALRTIRGDDSAVCLPLQENTQQPLRRKRCTTEDRRSGCWLGRTGRHDQGRNPRLFSLYPTTA